MESVDKKAHRKDKAAGFGRTERVLIVFLCVLMLMQPAAEAFVDTPQPGEKGEQVEQLKQRLYDLKYYTTKRYGKQYDDGTKQRVASFQRMNGLPMTGLVDETTWDVLFSDEARSAWRAPLITDATSAVYGWPVKPKDLPGNLTDGGFLAEGETPYVFAGRKEGYWRYISEDVSIEIRRVSESETPLVWFETEIRLSGGQKLCSLMDPAAKKIQMRDPRGIAEEYGAILAFSDDFYGYRKTRGINNAGTIIRDGQKISDRTSRPGLTKTPNMDVIALFEDGSMKTFLSGEHTAEEYLDMGVTDTWAFGPILLRDGCIDERLLEETLNYRDEDPRCAIGMIGPNHYMVLTVLGRQNTSTGVRPIWLAQRMKDLGCTEALNLDGGNSVALVFMGDMINKAEGADVNFMNGIRALASMIGVGFSASERGGE